ncbi:hypothetical protein EJ05DRAFT_123337 [Pseudovirgaria hyperparasitica]|uniref:Uncharacterized protein n=1 Tax=Pseudovirgaria hyperparasitica TaxID=470096 RepID=A0A6A6VZ49_9PEZI|nr:uncharacterized protein EJ05DRAFT_123337 [Pseudovirgaria hyperparasitica]KAF2755126.1 hypothetical protein EJ05DRAFT_123337 [Pseudovirgaria hyperparasitica]
MEEGLLVSTSLTPWDILYTATTDFKHSGPVSTSTYTVPQDTQPDKAESPSSRQGQIGTDYHSQVDTTTSTTTTTTTKRQAGKRPSKKEKSRGE